MTNTARKKRVSGIQIGSVPRSVPDGRFLWHNHVEHFVGMPHGLNVCTQSCQWTYRRLMRCRCGVVDLPHYSRRSFGTQKCVNRERVLRNSGMTAKQVRDWVRKRDAE
jgi:hypothetical protein